VAGVVHADRATQREALGFALVSRLLSIGFSPPDEESLHGLRRLAALGTSAVGDDGLAECLADLEHALGDDGLLEELAPAYEALFGGAVRCPPYEGSYESDPIRSSRELADVAGFYRAFGAAASGPASERPDHAGCELEFLSFLAVKRLAAEEAGEEEAATVCRDAEATFLQDHLGRWFPAFCREVAQASDAYFYRLLAVTGERFVLAELARRGIQASPVRPRRRTAVEGDEVSCGGEALPGLK
jgi:TorA maturation chaperone TorD